MFDLNWTLWVQFKMRSWELSSERWQARVPTSAPARSPWKRFRIGSAARARLECTRFMQDRRSWLAIRPGSITPNPTNKITNHSLNQSIYHTPHWLLIINYKNLMCFTEERYQSGLLLLTILHSLGSKPLDKWQVHCKNGSVKRLLDQNLKSSVIELRASLTSSTLISSPILTIKLSHLSLILKLIENRFFSFEVELLDSSNTKRRFRAANFQREAKVDDFICCMPLKLSHEVGAGNWNIVKLDLASLTERVFGTRFVETKRVSVNANCRLRRIYFTQRPYSNHELPADYQVLEAPRETTVLINMKQEQQTKIRKETTGFTSLMQQNPRISAIFSSELIKKPPLPVGGGQEANSKGRRGYKERASKWNNQSD